MIYGDIHYEVNHTVPTRNLNTPVIHKLLPLFGHQYRIMEVEQNGTFMDGPTCSSPKCGQFFLAYLNSWDVGRSIRGVTYQIDTLEKKHIHLDREHFT